MGFWCSYKGSIGVILGYIGIMEYKAETTVMGLYRVKAIGFRGLGFRGLGVEDLGLRD